jgi:hypothetical protein
VRLRRSDHGLSQSMLYLARWYSLGQRPPSFSEGFLAAARSGWNAGLQKSGQPLSEAEPTTSHEWRGASSVGR